MGWAAAIQGAAEAGSMFLQSQSAHKANRTNIRLQRENQEWLKMMSDTSMQRHMSDLRNAGVNPLFGLGTGGGATTPSSQPAHVEPTFKGGSVRIAELMALGAQSAKAKAEARLTNAQAAIEEKKVPHSAGMAQASADKIQEEVVRLGQDIEKADIDIRQRRAESEQYAKMAPLLIEAQRLSNASADLGLAREKLMSDIAKKFQWPVDRVDEFVKMLNEFGSSVGTSIADAEDWLRKNLPRFLEGARRGLAR